MTQVIARLLQARDLDLDERAMRASEQGKLDTVR